jgi:catechol 2,3-dioxygenase-like lactoylglutathione lyase family enzyme
MTFAFEALGFHVGMVVRDAKAVVDAYRDLFGGSFQMWAVPKAAPRQVDPSYQDSQLLIAYGRYAGMTIEVIQVLSGEGHYARWLERHGEGVQHLGFWVPDLAPAVERALEHGATLASATINPDSLGAVTVTGLSPSSIAGAILPGSVHMNYAQEATEIELLGPSSIETLRGMFGERLPEIVDLPAWDA